MVFRLGGEAVEGAADRDPRRQRVQEPQRGERVAVRVRRPARGFVRLPRSRSIEDPRVRGGGRFGGGGADGPESSMARRGRAPGAPTRRGGRPRAPVARLPSSSRRPSGHRARSQRSRGRPHRAHYQRFCVGIPRFRHAPDDAQYEERRVSNVKNAGSSLRRTPNFLGMPDSGRRQPEHLAARGTPLMFPQRGYRHWLWPRLNAPDGAGCSLSAQFPVTHTRDGITQHSTAHNGLIPPLCAHYRAEGDRRNADAASARGTSAAPIGPYPWHLGRGPRPALLGQGRKCT